MIYGKILVRIKEEVLWRVDRRIIMGVVLRKREGLIVTSYTMIQGEF